MVPNPERFTDNSQISPSQSMTVKNPSAQKSLSQILEELDIKYKTAINRLLMQNEKLKAIREVNNLL